MVSEEEPPPYVWPANGLVAHWPFSGNVDDDSGNGHDGTAVVGISFVNDQFGAATSAVQFNGAGVIEVLDDDAFSPGDGVTDTPFTLVAVIKVPTPTDTQAIISKYHDGTGPGFEWWMGFSGGGNVHLILHDQSKGSVRLGRTAPYLHTDWRIVIAEYNGNGLATGIKIFIDNVQLDDADTSFGTGYVAMENTATRVRLGARARNQGLNVPLAGDESEIAYYNRLLTSQEKTDMFNGLIP